MATISLKTARTQVVEPEQAAEELCAQLDWSDVKLVILFASSDRDQQALNRAVRTRLPRDTRLIGATTSGEIDASGIHSGTVVLGALSGAFEVGLGLGKGLSRDAVAAGADAIAQACRDLGVAPADINPQRHFAVVIDDGFRFKKEELLMGVLGLNPSLILVGGGASDSQPDPAKQSACVHVDGEVATDAALVALFHTDARWAAMRSHWYRPSGEQVRITKVDASHTRALEIDGKPAAQRYAEILGVAIDELEFGKPRGFSARPTGIKVGREYFLRSPWKPLPDGSILFANLLEEGTTLELMHSESFIGPTRDFLEREMRERVGTPTAALLFHCGGRIWTAQSAGVLDQLSAEFRSAPPAIGLNVHFEIYCGFHINSTLTAVAFGGGA